MAYNGAKSADGREHGDLGRLPHDGAFRAWITPGLMKMISSGFNRIVLWLTSTEYVFSSGMMISRGVCQWFG